MAEPLKIVKAELRELDSKGNETHAHGVVVQFNPETLKVSFANQIVPPTGKGADKRGTSAIQYVGKGTTKLNVQLWFDVSGVLPESQARVSDVRVLTQQVAYFITPTKELQPGQSLPPGVRFVWGTFKFDGIMESLEESLEFFSADGVPLRASVTMSLTQQGIQFAFEKQDPKKDGATAAAAAAAAKSGAGPASEGPAGTKPLAQARAGDTLQALASGIGKGNSWRAIAAANGIENPRLLSPGQLINLDVDTSGERGGR